MAQQPKASYRDAGVNIDEANRTKNVIKKLVKSTYTKDVMIDFGSFGGMFQVDTKKMKQPILVSSVDGVGTKLKVAFMTGQHDTVGMDIVNHCCNDILVQGAKPLFFMDYIAMGVHEPSTIRDVVKGLATACKASGCVLLGGEMAEMPDFYTPGEYDLAGMIVGVVDKKNVITGADVKPGDVILGLRSDGLHTNGFSLARHILFGMKKYRPSRKLKSLGCSVGEALLKPHRSYVEPIHKLMAKLTVKGMAHITGGGLTDNLVRVIPPNCAAHIEEASWDMPPIFPLMEKAGNVDRDEMYHVFNMGVGMTVMVDPKDVKRALSILRRAGETVSVIGEIRKGRRRVVIS